MVKPNFVFEYWDWCKKKGYNPSQSENKQLLNEFYHTEFHKKHPEYEVNGVELFQALGKF